MRSKKIIVALLFLMLTALIITFYMITFHGSEPAFEGTLVYLQESVLL